jgi:short-subunit dehydrogenase
MLSCANGVVAALALVVLHNLIRHHRWNQPLTFAANSTVLITGASSGIGLEIAKIFSASHCCVVLVGRNKTRLEDAAEDCRRAGAAEVTTVSADVTTEHGVASILREFKQRYRQLTYLVLNAGQGAIARFDDSPEYMEMCTKMMEVNYFANVRLMQAFVPILDKYSENQDRSKALTVPRILIISSLAGVFPSVLRSAYTASKHALQGFANAIRQELKVATVTIACPGFVDTSFHQRVLSSSAPSRVSTSHTRPGSMSAAECARDSLRAMRDGSFELVMTTSGRIGYILRPWIPQLVDKVAKRKALNSVQQ